MTGERLSLFLGEDSQSPELLCLLQVEPQLPCPCGQVSCPQLPCWVPCPDLCVLKEPWLYLEGDKSRARGWTSQVDE